jgi:restriction endonuclease S subunit
VSVLPSSWAHAPASRLLSHNIGGVWGDPPGNNDRDVLVVRVADFRDDGTISLATTPRRSITARQVESRQLRGGDILLEKSGGGPTKPVGRVLRVTAAPGPLVPTNFVQLIRPDETVVAPAFLFWWLWWSHLNGTAAGFQRATTNIRNLRTSDYLERPVPLPPLAEQRRIVAAIEEQFSRLDAAEAGLRRVSRKLATMRSAVVEQLLGGDWPRGKIKDCGDGSRHALAIGPFGSNLKTTDYRESGVPLVFVRNIRASSFGDAKAKYVATAKATELAAHVVRGGDVLVTKMGDPPGDTAVYPLGAPEAIITADCIKISLSDAFEPRFVALAIAARDARRQVLDATKGVAQKKVSLARFKEVEIPAPPIHEQIRIVAEVERNLSIAGALAKQVGTALDRSASLRRSILARAFAGDLVQQEPADEPASALLERIAAARGGETRATRPRATVPA